MNLLRPICSMVQGLPSKDNCLTAQESFRFYGTLSFTNYHCTLFCWAQCLSLRRLSLRAILISSLPFTPSCPESVFSRGFRYKNCAFIISAIHSTVFGSSHLLRFIHKNLRWRGQVGSSANTSDLYSGGSRFESWPGNYLRWLNFCSWSSSVPADVLVNTFKSSYYRFLSHSFQFIIHSYPNTHPTLRSPNYWQIR
jgi:hypothetical protein